MNCYSIFILPVINYYLFYMFFCTSNWSIFRISWRGVKFSLDTNAYTLGAKPGFPIFFYGQKYGQKNDFLPRGPWPWPVLYPLLNIFPFQFQFCYWWCISIPFLLSFCNVFPFQFQLGKYFSFNFVLQVFPFSYQLSIFLYSYCGKFELAFDRTC